MRWLVTAPYEVPRAESVDRQPWGMRHVRRDGAVVTVCGLPTSSWHTFWTLDFKPMDRASCPACARVFTRRATSAPV